jgi:hypothetical protein
MRLTATITRPDNTTAYTAGDVVGNTASIITFGAMKTGLNMILGTRLLLSVTAVPASMAAFNLHLYSGSPTNIQDNAAWTLPTADSTNYLGSVVLGVPVALIGDVIFSQDDEVNTTINVANNDNNIYGLLETVGGYTPGAETVHTIYLDIENRSV